MKTSDTTSESEIHERVVKMEELQDGQPMRTFYCIYDPDFFCWMSVEDFDGEIWTKDFDCRQEFETREEAQSELAAFLDWREEQEAAKRSAADRAKAA